MRNSTAILYLMIFVFQGVAVLQKRVASSKVRKAFAAKFESAGKAKWAKKDKQLWEVKFNLEDKLYSAVFNRAGQWLETRYELLETELPASVRNTLKSKFPEFDQEKIEISTKQNIIVYKIDLINDEEAHDVIISPNGKIIKDIDDESQEKIG
ncbi:MAG: PepSY-like domain-containing protein [Calditrichaeota bacterium]|nr:PepSY-like domain-containing protein [Calditrichota bacterium]